MKSIFGALLLTLISALPAFAVSHQTCVIVTGAPVREEIVDALSAKGYRPIVDNVVSEGDFYLSGEASCGIERGIFQWQVCVARIEIYLKVSNDRNALVASAESKEELNFELTNRYPRTEAKLSAIRKLPNCSIAGR